ncbi:MAG: FlgD immunoglobulin-like domain containing protein [Candidatus Tenebribacter davisii]|nr:FlgD immunoglobulin-like domain containing protein [Candidatus Tenebribacter davisii]
MKLFKLFFIFFMLISVTLVAEIINYSQLPEKLQTKVIPDMDGRVLISDLESQLIENEILSRELPSVANGWPVSYTGSNCKNGAIYVNMDADADLEILFGVGTKITALNLDGSTVTGWPVQLGFYIWSSPAAGDIDGDGEIEIVCTSRNNSSANTGALYAFELDGTPCTGFPVTQAGGGTNNVCLYDLDANGDMEILVNIRNYPQGWVYVFDGDGSEYPGFPQELDYIPGAGISAGDVTGDGIPEIIALSYNKLHVYDLAGNLLSGFPLENTGYTYSYSQPILYDLDDDGLREIIWGGCSSNAGAVFAVNNDASSAAGWPQTTDQWIFGTVALGDVDQDGSLDVVVGDQVSSGTPANHIYAWDSGGNALTGFPAGPTNAIYAQIGIADLDGDNNVELMIDDNNFGFGYDCYNHDGTHCTDWPLPCGTVWSSTTMQISPIFGDVDNDGDLEIMGAATDIMNWVVECYLWDTDSAWNEDLAYMIIDGVNIQHNGLYDPDEASAFYPPTNPEAEIQDYNDVLLTWEEPIITDEILSGYKVYQNGIEFAKIMNPATLNYLVEALDAGTYEYAITAIYTNPDGESVPTAPVTAEIVLNPPSNVDAQSQPPNIMITWQAPERGVDNYNIYRDDMLIEEGVTGFMFIDLNISPYHYWNITAVYDGDWESEFSETVGMGSGTNPNLVPLVTKLNNNYPNPFNPETLISFSTTEAVENTVIIIYNLKGQKIKTLLNEILPAGDHTVNWNGTDDNGKNVSSGVYLYKMQAGNYIETKKMILIK